MSAMKRLTVLLIAFWQITIHELAVTGVEELRDHYGEDWLRSGAGDKLYTLLGIEEKEVENDTGTIIQDMVAEESDVQSKVCVQRKDSLAVSELASELSSGDAIEKADVVMREEEKDIATSWYKVAKKREARVRIDEVEELVLLINSELRREQYDENESMNLGITACEMLDLTTIITKTANRTSAPRIFGMEAGIEWVLNIQNYVVNSPDANLLNFLPRPEPRMSKISADEESSRLGQENSCSSGLLKSESSSSDISVLSNPSECSSKVLSIKMEQEATRTEVPNQVDLVTPVKGELKMAESSSVSYFSDYSSADHRVQLFREEVDLLLLAKGFLHLQCAATPVWLGVLVVTIRRIYTLKINKNEVLSAWLELWSSANVQMLRRLVRGHGVGLELQTINKPVQPSFCRLPVVATGYNWEGTDGYYLIMEDSGRVDKMMDQLVERLQESVRSTPLPR